MRSWKIITTVVVGMGAGAPLASAQVYNWVPWTSTGGQTAAATDPGMGTVTVSVSENGTNATTPFPVRFDGVDFTPVDAPSVSVGSFPVQEWAFTIDFTQVPNTSGVIVGIGNFGHGTPSLPGYRLAAFDTLGLAMPLTALVQIGSYDHTWTAFGFQFNDDVTLNTGSGDFVVTVVAGQNENNTDILLMSLPGGVQRLVVSTVGPTGGETINVLIATASVLAGDYNADGLVDAADYVVWRKNNNTAVTLPNDATPGTSPADYDVWRGHFGQPGGSGSGAGANAAIPEPATLVLLMFAAVGWCLRRHGAVETSQQVVNA